jgi:hypothetical protein
MTDAVSSTASLVGWKGMEVDGEEGSEQSTSEEVLKDWRY